MFTCLTITVIGKVQGVFYRQSALETAMLLGIKGFVSNEPNGNVHIEAEGEKRALNKFVDWCKKGPPRAVVTDVKAEVQNFSPLKNFSSFEIRK